MWSLSGHTATLNLDGLSISVDLRRPDLGLTIGQPGNVSSHWLGVLLDPSQPAAEEPVFDAYVRGQDLIVTYAQTAERTVQPQVYWRAWCGQSGEPKGIETLVSAQTSLLASRPELQIVTRLGQVEEVLALAPHDDGEAAALQGNIKTTEALLLVRGAIPDRSLALMINPSDLVNFSRESSDKQTTLSAQLFPDSLEKGVIRRGRAGLFLVERGHDATTARAVFDRFLSQPLPLTA
jgi:hypothetical protein